MPDDFFHPFPPVENILHESQKFISVISVSIGGLDK